MRAGRDKGFAISRRASGRVARPTTINTASFNNSHLQSFFFSVETAMPTSVINAASAHTMEISGKDHRDLAGGGGTARMAGIVGLVRKFFQTRSGSSGDSVHGNAPASSVAAAGIFCSRSSNSWIR